MPSTLTKLILFLSSYTPLWLIFAFVLKKHQILSGAFLALVFLSIVGTVLYFKIVQRFEAVPRQIERVTRKDSDTMSYIATYVVPFAATGMTDENQLFALAVFLFVLATVYVNSGMIHINPVLALARYRLYEIEEGDATPFTVVTRSSLQRGDTLYLIEVGQDIYVEKMHAG